MPSSIIYGNEIQLTEFDCNKLIMVTKALNLRDRFKNFGLFKLCALKGEILQAKKNRKNVFSKIARRTRFKPSLIKYFSYEL